MEENLEEKNEKCEHDWEAIGEKHSGTHLEIRCKKCGKKKRDPSFSMIHVILSSNASINAHI